MLTLSSAKRFFYFCKNYRPIINHNTMRSNFNNLMKGFLLALALMLVSGVASAKPFTIKGVVSDQDNYPLPGAAIQIEGTMTGTMADEKGEFTLSAEKGQVMLVSFIGFQTKSVKITDQMVYLINLDPDTNFLEETVVVGYDTQKKVNLTGSVSSVSTEQLNNPRSYRLLLLFRVWLPALP